MAKKLNIELGALPLTSNKKEYKNLMALEEVSEYVTSKMGNVHELETKVIKDNFLKTYKELIEVLESAETASDKFKLDAVSFTLTIDISGKVSLLSASGGGSQKTGITVTLKPKDEQSA